MTTAKRAKLLNRSEQPTKVNYSAVDFAFGDQAFLCVSRPILNPIAWVVNVEKHCKFLYKKKRLTREWAFQPIYCYIS